MESQWFRQKAESSSRCYAHEAFVGGPNGNQPPAAWQLPSGVVRTAAPFQQNRRLLGHILFCLTGFSRSRPGEPQIPIRAAVDVGLWRMICGRYHRQRHQWSRLLLGIVGNHRRQGGLSVMLMALFMHIRWSGSNRFSSPELGWESHWRASSMVRSWFGCN